MFKLLTFYNTKINKIKICKISAYNNKTSNNNNNKNNTNNNNKSDDTYK